MFVTSFTQPPSAALAASPSVSAYDGGMSSPTSGGSASARARLSEETLYVAKASFVTLPVGGPMQQRKDLARRRVSSR